MTQTTVGSNVEHVMYKNTQLQIWDLGGQQSLRPFWATYYKGADAVIMVRPSPRFSPLPFKGSPAMYHDAKTPERIDHGTDTPPRSHMQVVDSTDRARIGVAKSELFGLLENEELAKVPILVLANKQV